MARLRKGSAEARAYMARLRKLAVAARAKKSRTKRNPLSRHESEQVLRAAHGGMESALTSRVLGAYADSARMFGKAGGRASVVADHGRGAMTRAGRAIEMLAGSQADESIRQDATYHRELRRGRNPGWPTAIQYTTRAKTEAEAREVFAAMKMQDDFLGGRIVPPSPEKPGWLVQTFGQDAPEIPLGSEFMEGARRVVVPPAMQRYLRGENPRTWSAEKGSRELFPVNAGKGATIKAQGRVFRSLGTVAPLTGHAPQTFWRGGSGAIFLLWRTASGEIHPSHIADGWLRLRSEIRRGLRASNPPLLVLGNPKGARSRFYHERLESPGAFDPRSFRTVRTGKGARVVVGCPRGQWDARAGVCRVGTRAQAVLHPNPLNKGERDRLAEHVEAYDAAADARASFGQFGEARFYHGRAAEAGDILTLDALGTLGRSKRKLTSSGRKINAPKGTVAVVRYKSETAEFQVTTRQGLNGPILGTYFTNDYADAMGTAAAEAETIVDRTPNWIRQDHRTPRGGNPGAGARYAHLVTEGGRQIIGRIFSTKRAAESQARFFRKGGQTIRVISAAEARRLMAQRGGNPMTRGQALEILGESVRLTRRAASERRGGRLIRSAWLAGQAGGAAGVVQRKGIGPKTTRARSVRVEGLTAREYTKTTRIGAARGVNPSGLPPAISNSPAFRSELAAYRRRHGGGPVEIVRVRVPQGYPRFMSAWGHAPYALYDAPGHSNKGKRIHRFGEGGGRKPYLVSSASRGPKFLAYVGGTFRADGRWILK